MSTKQNSLVTGSTLELRSFRRVSSGKLLIVGKRMKKRGGVDKLKARFALLRHTLPRESTSPSHWDLMLENGPALTTFRLLELPKRLTSGPMLAFPAERLSDHRMKYLAYEGLVSGNRGSVQQIATGNYVLHFADDGPSRLGLSADCLEADLFLPLHDLPGCKIGQQIEILVQRWNLKPHSPDAQD